MEKDGKRETGHHHPNINNTLTFRAKGREILGIWQSVIPLPPDRESALRGTLCKKEMTFPFAPIGNRGYGHGQ